MSDQLELWPEEGPGDRLLWSLSRDRRLRDCSRKYFLHHFGSRGGWLPDARPEARQAFVLRHLRTRQMWVGTLVHEAIELTLGVWRRGEAVAVDALVERSTQRMRAQYAQSLQRVYWDKPLNACGLLEHEYEEPVSRDEWVAQRNRMQQCLRAFFASPLAANLRAMPPWRYLAVETQGSFDLEGVTVLVRPDLAWRDPDGSVAIVDWKTGKARPDDGVQLATYALFARRLWGLAPEQLRALVVYLDGESATVSEQSVSAASLEAAAVKIRDSAASMRALGPAGEALAEVSFPMTDDLSRCVRCPFKRLCGR